MGAGASLPEEPNGGSGVASRAHGRGAQITRGTHARAARMIGRFRRGALLGPFFARSAWAQFRAGRAWGLSP